MLGFQGMRADLEYITGVLDELESLVQDASNVPMNRARAMVDRSDVLVLVKELRDSLPGELEEAKAIHREHESIVDSGREEAERIVQNARQRAQEMVADSETYRRAQRRADENLDSAEKYSEEVCRGSEAYREQVMAQVERWFGESMQSVADSRQEFEVRDSHKSREDRGAEEGREDQESHESHESREVPSGEQNPLDDTRPQERQEPIAGDRENGGGGWRASSA
ncbi:ATP synthase subunit B family protein [Rubrobacter aplysinae]|uniref:hypothetical protein n=1 Tax=Rubrobacter aplysinae TaxID=909625 RepID=UPI00128C1AF6|nr:hypothetical protein [Rubrobacter aplysinae]